jgi:hypothetical protein
MQDIQALTAQSSALAALATSARATGSVSVMARAYATRAGLAKSAPSDVLEPCPHLVLTLEFVRMEAARAIQASLGETAP